MKKIFHNYIQRSSLLYRSYVKNVSELETPAVKYKTIYPNHKHSFPKCPGCPHQMLVRWESKPKNILLACKPAPISEESLQTIAQ